MAAFLPPACWSTPTTRPQSPAHCLRPRNYISSFAPSRTVVPFRCTSSLKPVHACAENVSSPTKATDPSTTDATPAGAEGWAVSRTMVHTLVVDADFVDGSSPGVHFTSAPAMTIADLLAIIYQDCPDAWVNEILRTLLGWLPKGGGEGGGRRSYGDEDGSTDTPLEFDDSAVRADWRKLYAEGPPDFIGVNGDYTPEFDRPVKLAVQRLSKTTKLEHKQLLKQVLKPHGFKGWKVEQLTPNRTRRAQAVNWVLHWYYSHYSEYEWK